VLLVGSCGLKPIVPKFPKVEPDLVFSVKLKYLELEDGKVVSVVDKCFARCLDLQRGGTIEPKHCGAGEPDDVEHWEVDPHVCNRITGPKDKTWAESWVPWIKECYRYALDNLGGIAENIISFLEKE